MEGVQYCGTLLAGWLANIDGQTDPKLYLEKHHRTLGYQCDIYSLNEAGLCPNMNIQKTEIKLLIKINPEISILEWQDWVLSFNVNKNCYELEKEVSKLCMNGKKFCMG